MEDIEIKCLKVSSEQIKNNYTFGKSAMKDLARYIDKTLDRLEQLEEENKELKNNKTIVEKILTKGKGFTLEQTKYIWENYISKAKIKEKIEELEKVKGKYSDTPRLYTAYDTYDFQTNILKELLGEE